ncbi:MAG: RES domain-containing protein [Alphaproteobacteria bacterium]|jgi:RES domain-containing protein|nr:RES domain-containing protein [Alphaproteobacteria bacterium]
MKSGPRDVRLIDSLEAIQPVPVSALVWRVVRDGRDPCQCRATGGRWDDGTFDVLYTSRDRDGAIAEILFHLKRGQPVIPSQVRYRLYELHLELNAVLDLSAPGALETLGVQMSRFGQLAFEEREAEYPRSQDIAEVAHFLEFTGIIVPSARWTCENIVVFCGRVPPDAIEAVKDHGLIDFPVWEAGQPRERRP